MKDVRSASKGTKIADAAWLTSIAAFLIDSGRNLWKKQQTVKLPYVKGIVFYGVKNVEKYVDRFSSYGGD
ncbi:MAG: hypothetical protein LBP41_04130 [Holosporaceae bacterium]|nr:hypothetical protein [Holosporaceae bacterium]